jgi:hypothetical protein
MRNPTAYLKMRVLGAIDMAEGNSIQARIRAVSQMTFTDEDGHPRQFTWRTIQTWYSRYQKHGVTVMHNQPRSDKGKVRKVVIEDVLDALRKVSPKIHGKTPTLALLYRLCIEAGLLTRSQIAPNTFRRVVKQYELLKPDAETSMSRSSASPSTTPCVRSPKRKTTAGVITLRRQSGQKPVKRQKSVRTMPVWKSGRTPSGTMPMWETD